MTVCRGWKAAEVGKGARGAGNSRHGLRRNVVNYEDRVALGRVVS